MLFLVASGCYSERRHFAELHGFAVRGECLMCFVTNTGGVVHVVRGADTRSTFVPKYERLFTVKYDLGGGGDGAKARGGVSKAWEGAPLDMSRMAQSSRMREFLSGPEWREFGVSWRLEGGGGWEKAEPGHVAEGVAAEMAACGFDVATLCWKARSARGDVYLGWRQDEIAVCVPGRAAVWRTECPGAEDAVWLPAEDRLVVSGAPAAGSVTPHVVWDWNYASGEVREIRLGACSESRFMR